LPIIKNVLLKDGQIRSTDLDTEIIVNVPEISGEPVLLPHKTLTELLKYVPGNLMVSITGESKKVKLSWTGGSCSYLTPDASDFPPSALRMPMTEAVLNGDTLIGSLVDALKYAATNDARPVLTGVNVKLGENLEVCAADGFRACYESLKMSYPEPQSINVPAGTIKIMEKLWNKEPARPSGGNSLVSMLTSARHLKLGLWTGFMSASFNNIVITSKLIDGKFPDVLSLFNSFQEPIKVQFLGTELMLAIKRIERVAKAGTEIVRLLWDEKKMIVLAKHDEDSEVEVEIPVLEGSNPGRIALKYEYLEDYLMDKPGLITMGNAGRTTPCVFHFGTRPLVSIMPMKASWSDDAPKEEVAAGVAAGAPETEADTAAGESEPAEEGGEEAEAADENGEEEPVTQENETEGE
ncbi:MAG: DNA polymerase III subunit beta, partial [Dehalococcoidales bacterium]|nr:DNA polymerase III subunit beta [Dehalococcoidales bacterium]